MKLNRLFLAFLCLFLVKYSFASPISGIEAINVTDQNFKMKMKKEFHFAFAEGDEVIFNFEVVDGKPLKELEIFEYPETSKYSEYKTSKITNKKIKIQQTGVYKFYLKGSLRKRICKLKIDRIPASEETIKFNTTVKWETKLDTSYIKMGQVKKLLSIDTTVVSVIDRVERVHSLASSNENSSSFSINLPRNIIEGNEESEVISWAYWIGTGEEGKAAYQAEEKQLLADAATEIGVVSPIAGLALGVFAMSYNPASGENVKYKITYRFEGDPNTYTLAEGNSVVSKKRIDKFTQGSFWATLDNDNLIEAINVNMKVSAVVVKRTFEYEDDLVPWVTSKEYPVIQE